MPKQPRDDNRNITRIDTTTRGYWVRVTRAGECHSKLFSDGQCGGKRKALKEAREYRDELLKKLSDLTVTRKQRAETVTSRNFSGIPGVRYVEEVTRSGGKEYTHAYWEAQWSPRPYQRKKRRFSVKKYGDETAMQMAIEAREQGVAEMEE